MSKLSELREKLNLTQEELAEKSNISVRTIQRIEAGAKPKKFTLDSLAKALNVSKSVLLEKKSELKESSNKHIKYVNLSSILLLIIPLGSIIMPLIIMNWKKENNAITKQIVSIQILWTISTLIITVLVALLSKWFSLEKEIVPVAMLVLIMINLYIIFRNAIELEKTNKLRIHLKFNLL